MSPVALNRYTFLEMECSEVLIKHADAHFGFAFLSIDALIERLKKGFSAALRIYTPTYAFQSPIGKGECMSGYSKTFI